MIPTLNETWKMFMDERKICLCPTTIDSDYKQVTKWVNRCPIQDITQGRQIMIWIYSQSPVKSARRVALFVKCMYKWACGEDISILEKNPVLNFKSPKPPQQSNEIIVISRDEVSIILQALKEKEHHRKIRWDLYAEFMLQTGMRTGEVRALRYNDIKENKILVHSNYTLTHGLKNSTKTNKQRWVPLNSRCLEILKELNQECDYIFPWNRQSFQSFFREKIDEKFNENKLKFRFRPYDLRHTAISRWLEAGIPVTQVANWAGNTSEVIWKYYANTTQEFEIPIL